MATNRNQTLAARSQNCPARYNRTFARSQWRKSFGDRDAFRHLRQPGREGSFRHYTGRTVRP